MEKISYNNLESIDQLIERLEVNLPTSNIKDKRIDRAIQRRKQQIEQLKLLRDEAAQQSLIEQELERLENDNEQIDEIIAGYQQCIRKSKQKVKQKCVSLESRTYGSSSESRCSESNYGYSSESRSKSSYGYSSESRCGESRW